MQLPRQGIKQALSDRQALALAPARDPAAVHGEGGLGEHGIKAMQQANGLVRWPPEPVSVH